MAYAGGKTLYAWNISDVKVYDKPMMLEDFRYAWCIDHVQHAPQGITYVHNPHNRCINCAARKGNHCLTLHCYLHVDPEIHSCSYWTRKVEGGQNHEL